MGEAELAARSASQIGMTSILAHGNADALWRARAAWVQLKNRFQNVFYDASGVFSLLAYLISWAKVVSGQHCSGKLKLHTLAEEICCSLDQNNITLPSKLVKQKV